MLINFHKDIESLPLNYQICLIPYFDRFPFPYFGFHSQNCFKLFACISKVIQDREM